MCIDYRGVNNLTRKDSYPLPRISDCLDALGAATYFSTFDLRSGYFQIAMDENDMDKTSFITRRGTFRFTSMPFGLCNAPATFQRVMDVVLTGLNYEICLVYLDDIILFSHTVSEHLVRLCQLLNRLRGANLKLKPSKCHLLKKTVTFLGHVVSAGSIATDPAKIIQVREWPTPRDVTEVRSFVGLCSYYRRFIQSFSQIAAPLHALTGKHAKFQWTQECDEAFTELKRRLITSPVLAMPADEGEYTLDTDASNQAIGAVLSQIQNGNEKVIAYASRMLSGPERNYCVTRKELLAVVFFTKQFRPYLLGRKFVIRTDHSALRWLKSTPEPIGQQARWLERLEEFDYQIEHRPGKSHNNADALSRRPCRQCHKDLGKDDAATVGSNTERISCKLIQFGECSTESNWHPEKLKEAYMADSELRNIYQWKQASEEQVPWEDVVGLSQITKVYWRQWERLKIDNGLLYRRWDSLDGTHHHYQLIPPKSYRNELIQEAHTGITGGHLGIKKTEDQLQRRAYWYQWGTDVRRFCQQCPKCCTYHRGNPPKQGALQVTKVGEPLERLAIDLTGPHPTSRSGNIYILTTIDLFTKWAEAIPLRNKEAITVARALFDVVISRFGLPMQLLSDNGKEFENSLMIELCRLLGVEKLRTTAYKPSTNGAVERFHRTLNAMIAKTIADNQRNWDELLPGIMAAYRSSSHEATGFSPNFLMFGRENRAPLDILYGFPEDEATHHTSYNDYADTKVENMRYAYDLVRQHVGEGAERMRHYYDMKVKSAAFKVNTWVYYYNPRRFTRKSPKWQRMYQGPYLIVRMYGAVNAVLQQSKKSKPFVTHIDKLKPCGGPTPVSWLRMEEDQTRNNPEEEQSTEASSNNGLAIERAKQNDVTDNGNTTVSVTARQVCDEDGQSYGKFDLDENIHTAPDMLESTDTNSCLLLELQPSNRKDELIEIGNLNSGCTDYSQEKRSQRQVIRPRRLNDYVC
jgi:transposase InsO family protein